MCRNVVSPGRTNSWVYLQILQRKNYRLLLSVVLGLFFIRLYLEDLGQMDELCGIGGCHTMCLEIH